jgi:tRNA(Ile)-lysidine synthase
MDHISSNLKPLFTLWRHLLPSLLKNKQGVTIACSGGSDSTALLHLLLAFKKHHMPELKLAVAHVNYNLRKESERDSLFIHDLAGKNSLPLFIHNVKKKNFPPKNLQAWAREIRYTLFENISSENWILALAHTQDDLVENIILRLCRGSSPESLLGMSSWFAPYWRPLLETNKKELTEYLQENSFPHCEDSTNACDKYTRNHIRRNVLPELNKVFPGYQKRLIRCISQGAQASSLLKADLLKKQNFPETVTAYPKLTAINLIAAYIQKHSRTKPQLSFQKLSDLYNLIISANDKERYFDISNEQTCTITNKNFSIHEKTNKFLNTNKKSIHH